MRVLFRADATSSQGTGHVMRCLSLAEAVINEGHEAVIMTNESGIPWLKELLRNSKPTIIQVEQHSLDQEFIGLLKPQWIVIDSYEISVELINLLSSNLRVLSIIDGDSRGIEADLYLDQNLGAESLEWSEHVSKRLLAGSQYSLIRDAVILSHPLKTIENNPPHIVAVMGGSDPTGSIIEIAKAIALAKEPISATVIAADAWNETVHQLLDEKPGVNVIPPTTTLHIEFAKADIAISAAGTSAWELCTLCKPSLLLAVVQNQVESLKQLVKHELVLGIDATVIDTEQLCGQISTNLSRLLSDQKLRNTFSTNCCRLFDGKGKYRVLKAMENLLAFEESEKFDD